MGERLSDARSVVDIELLNSLTISGIEAGTSSLKLKADEGDDVGDNWNLSVADGGVLTINNDIGGTDEAMLTVTPTVDAASSTTSIAGKLAVTGATTFKRNIVTITVASDADNSTTLTEAQSGSIVTVNTAACASSGSDTTINLPGASDTAGGTATPGLTYEIHIVGTPGHAAALINVSTGHNDVNFAAYSYFIGAHASADGVSICGTRAHSRLILTPATPAESLDTVIKCTCLTTTLWRIECFEPAAAASNFTTQAAL
jgi:hypothetical protein